MVSASFQGCCVTVNQISYPLCASVHRVVKISVNSYKVFDLVWWSSSHQGLFLKEIQFVQKPGYISSQLVSTSQVMPALKPSCHTLVIIVTERCQTSVHCQECLILAIPTGEAGLWLSQHWETLLCLVHALWHPENNMSSSHYSTLNLQQQQCQLLS